MFTYVSSTKRDSVVGVLEIQMDGEVDGWEARRGPGQVLAGRAGRGPGGASWPSAAAPGSRASAGPWPPRQTSHSSGWSLVCSRSGWLGLVSFCQVLEGLHSSVALLVPVGASLAALWGHSLRILLLLLLHLLYNFPDLALCRLASKEMPDNSDNHFLILIWCLVTRHDDFCAG